MLFWIWIILGLLGAFIVFSILASASLFRGLIVKPNFGEKNAPLSKSDRELFFSENAKAVEWFNTLQREEVFVTNNGLKLHGVYIDQKSDKSVILIHGYAAKLKYRIQDAPFYYKQGFNILLIDLRTHGDSGGKYITLGKYESLDLLKWIEWLNQRTNNSKIVLDGVSMGAATVLCATALDLPANVVFAVSDCSYTTMRDLELAIYVRFILLPDWLVIGLLELYAHRWGKFSFYKNGPIDCVKKAKIPILFIHGQGDKLIPPAMTNKLYENCTSKKMLLKIPKAGHAMSFCYDRQKCNDAILKFIDLTMNSEEKQGTSEKVIGTENRVPKKVKTKVKETNIVSKKDFLKNQEKQTIKIKAKKAELKTNKQKN